MFSGSVFYVELTSGVTGIIGVGGITTGVEFVD